MRFPSSVHIGLVSYKERKDICQEEHAACTCMQHPQDASNIEGGGAVMQSTVVSNSKHHG